MKEPQIFTPDKIWFRANCIPYSRNEGDFQIMKGGYTGDGGRTGEWWSHWQMGSACLPFVEALEEERPGGEEQEETGQLR